MSNRKFMSRRFWFAVWAASMVSYIIMRPLMTDWTGSAVSLLVGIVGIYIGSESYTKTHGKGQ